MYPNHSQPKLPNALPASTRITLYVLLVGVAGGLALAFVVMVCCKLCLKKRKPFARQHVVFDRGSDRQHDRARKYHSLESSISVDIETSCGYPDSSQSSRESREYDPESVIEAETLQSWPPLALPDSVPETRSPKDIELQELKTTGVEESKSSDETSSPERPPEVTSAVRRRSSVGIQRQASVCLSDEEDQEELGALARRPTASRKKEVTKVSAVVHHSGNDKPLAHSWEQKSIKSTSLSTGDNRHPPFIHSHSSPDSKSTATMLEIKHGRQPSVFSLRGVGADTLARIIDLEDYHYSRQQVWELASQGATLLRERSQSSLDVANAGEGWDEVSSQIQQATSTEAGFLERSLEQQQLENVWSLLRRYSPVDEEDTRSWSKVRYNDTGSREDIRDEVIEIISGESEDESNSSNESEIGKQQYKKLWELRATLEEEEDELSDAEEIGEAPLAQQEDFGQFTSQTASFESNAEISGCDTAEGGGCGDGLCDYLQLPLHEMRRHCYKNLLTKRLQRRTPCEHRSGSGCGGESSFESVDSSSTDRTEGGTTSFESTTDNTDSTGELQTNRLQQMKADSGYKSIESNGKAPRLSKKQLQFALDADSLDVMLAVGYSVEEENTSFDTSRDEGVEKDISKTKCSTDTAKKKIFESFVSGIDIPVIIETVPEKKKSKSALKKHHTEGDSPWSSEQTIDISSEPRTKTSVFQKLFRSGRFRPEQFYFYRDYSIDQKSDALFREFSRPEFHESEFRNRGSRLHSHIRLHHRSLSSTEGGSPHLARKVLSPQLSIEEESCENVEEQQLGSEEKYGTKQQGENLKSPHETQAQIPVIYLSQGRREGPT